MALSKRKKLACLLRSLGNSKRLIPKSIKFRADCLPLHKANNVAQPVYITDSQKRVLHRFGMNPRRGHDATAVWECVLRGCGAPCHLAMPICDKHLAEHYRVRIGKSTIVSGGLGLFVVDSPPESFVRKLERAKEAANSIALGVRVQRKTAREIRSMLDKKLCENVAFTKGEFIMHYSGEKLTNRQHVWRYPDPNSTATYCISGFGKSGMFNLDGAFYRFPAHYINQAPDKKSRNASFIARDIGVYATRDIHYGEELFAVYGSSYHFGPQYQTVFQYSKARDALMKQEQEQTECKK